MSDQQKLTSQVFRSLQTREIDTFKTKKWHSSLFVFLGILMLYTFWIISLQWLIKPSMFRIIGM